MSTKETERFFRLTMEHQKRKIDACVALSFAILGAIRNGRPMDPDRAGLEPFKPVSGKFDARQPTFPGYGVRRMR